MNHMSAGHQSNQIITGVARGRRGWRTVGRWLAPLVGSLRHRASATVDRLTAGLQRTRPVVLLAAVAIALAGCSSIRLGYDKLPFLAGWELDRYLDLNGDQEKLADRQLRDFQAWHRKAQLPKYAALLRQVEEQVDEPMTVERVARWRNEALDTWPELVERLAPAVAGLAVTLTPAQLDHFDKALVEANRKIENEYYVGRNPKALRAARIKRSRERAENFLGPLNAPQLARLEQRADDEGTLATSHRWAVRLPRQQILVDLLRGLATDRPPIGEATARTEAALLSLVRPTDPVLKAKTDAAELASDRYMADLLGQASPVQRRHLVERLRGYGSDLDRLMALVEGAGVQQASPMRLPEPLAMQSGR